MSNYEIELFTKEALKILPNLSVKHNTFNKIGYPFFIDTNSKIYPLESVRRLVKNKKLELIINWLIDKEYIKNFTQSPKSISKYFTINGHKIRLSDHEMIGQKFNGLDVIIKWDSSSKDILNMILNRAIGGTKIS